MIDEDQLIDDGLCALETILKSKNPNDPNTIEYRESLERLMRNRFWMHRPSYELLPNKKGSSSFNCGWCKERIVGEDIQKHINKCSRHSPEHPANMVKALKEIVNDC